MAGFLTLVLVLQAPRGALAAQCGDAFLTQFTAASGTVEPISNCATFTFLANEVFGTCWYSPCIAMDFQTGSSYWESVGSAIQLRGASGHAMWMTETMDVSSLSAVREWPESFVL